MPGRIRDRVSGAWRDDTIGTGDTPRGLGRLVEHVRGRLRGVDDHPPARRRGFDIGDWLGERRGPGAVGWRSFTGSVRRLWPARSGTVALVLLVGLVAALAVGVGLLAEQPGSPDADPPPGSAPPTPTPTPTATPTPRVTPSPTATASPTATSTATAIPTTTSPGTRTATQTPTVSPSPSPTPTPEPVGPGERAGEAVDDAIDGLAGIKGRPLGSAVDVGLDTLGLVVGRPA